MILDLSHLASTLPYISLGLIVVLIGWIIRLEIKIKRLLVGSDSHSLEESLLTTRTQLDNLNSFKTESTGYFKEVEARLQRSIQAVETVRFNPFKGSGEGGTQSFSTAFADEKGNGVVISSLYSRDRVSIFSKELKKFGSDIELTEEEKNVVEDAKKKMVR